MTRLARNNIEITNLAKSALSRALFADMHQKILGSSYELSLNFVTPKIMKELSIKWKGDDTHMNVLSFPLSKSSGEIFVCTETAKEECLSYGRGCRQHIKFLVIHGMLHLAGYTHGSKMESKEKFFMSKFSK